MYGMSKLAINLYAQILGRDKQVIEKDIQVYSECPGYVKTDMTEGKGHIEVEEGIKTTIHLMAIPYHIDKSTQGAFFEKSHVSSTFEPVGQTSCNLMI
jgi:NAD(P)-dependent dehydrogenase (short-subunit alcohol dehydrogenase family)